MEAYLRNFCGTNAVQAVQKRLSADGITITSHNLSDVKRNALQKLAGEL